MTFRIGSSTFWFFLIVLAERPSSPFASQSSAARRTVFDGRRNRSAVRLAAGTVPERGLKVASGSHRRRSSGPLGGILGGQDRLPVGFMGVLGLASLPLPQSWAVSYPAIPESLLRQRVSPSLKPSRLQRRQGAVTFAHRRTRWHSRRSQAL